LLPAVILYHVRDSFSRVITMESFSKSGIIVQTPSFERTLFGNVRLQISWTLLFGVIYKKIADLLLR